jgi:hypothetical protein
MIVEHKTIRRSQIKQSKLSERRRDDLRKAIDRFLPELLAGEPTITTEAELNSVKAFSRRLDSLAGRIGCDIDALLCRRIFEIKALSAQIKSKLASKIDSTEAGKLRRKITRINDTERLFRGTLLMRTMREAKIL